MELIMSYGLFFDDEAVASHGGVAEIYRPAGEGDPPSAMAGISETDFRHHHEATYVVELTDGRRVRVFWNANLFGERFAHESLQAGPCVLARIDAFARYKLVARSEPTVDHRLGVTISNEEGKVLMLGVGDVVKGEHGHHLVVQGHETYQWRAASPSACAHTNYAVRNPGTTPVKLKEAPDAGTDGG
jgi:hypothetical protein